MRILVPMLAILGAAALPGNAQSDVEIKGAVATQFTRTKGASLLGRDVHWHVPSKVFHVPKKSRKGVALYVSQGIGILTDAQSSSVDEVRRRGGQACVRGRVVKVPEKDRQDGDPAYAIVVSSLSHRRD